MKFLFDLLPVILFFVAFKMADIYVATGVAMAATVAQIIWVAAKYKKVEPMQWASLGLIMVFGGLTIGLQDKTFIQWKPTILYWLFALGLIASATIWKKNLIQAAMAHQISLKPGVGQELWVKLNNAWAIFFLIMGFINLYVAYQFDETTWVNFKLFGGMGILFAFIIAQGIWLNQFIVHESK
jgi:intracellular septation protein